MANKRVAPVRVAETVRRRGKMDSRRSKKKSTTGLVTVPVVRVATTSAGPSR